MGESLNQACFSLRSFFSRQFFSSGVELMKTTFIKIFLFATMLLVGPTANASITDDGAPTADPLTLAGGNTAGSVIANASSEVQS